MTSTATLYSAPERIDATIAQLARVSSDKPDNPEYERLIGYLIKHGHWSPFDMVNLVIEVDTQKDIAIQILRHSNLKPQEYSQRYADCSKMFSEGYRECRLQHPTNRQLSVDTDDPELARWWMDAQDEVINLSFKRYRQAIGQGIAKEVARAILPIGLTNTKLFLNGSIRSWLFYCKARLDATSQLEHRQLAQQVLNILKNIAPCTTAAFIEQMGMSELYMAA